MNRRTNRNFFIALAVFLVLPFGGVEAAETEEAETTAAISLIGDWSGSLEVSPEVSLPLIFRITETEAGELEVKIDSPAQGAVGIPVESVEIREGRATFDVSAIGAVYEGELGADGETVAGEWKQSGRAMALTITREGES